MPFTQWRRHRFRILRDFRARVIECRCGPADLQQCVMPASLSGSSAVAVRIEARQFQLDNAANAYRFSRSAGGVDDSIGRGNPLARKCCRTRSRSAPCRRRHPPRAPCASRSPNRRPARSIECQRRRPLPTTGAHPVLASAAAGRRRRARRHLQKSASRWSAERMLACGVRAACSSAIQEPRAGPACPAHQVCLDTRACARADARRIASRNCASASAGSGAPTAANALATSVAAPSPTILAIASSESGCAPRRPEHGVGSVRDIATRIDQRTVQIEHNQGEHHEFGNLSIERWEIEGLEVLKPSDPQSLNLQMSASLLYSANDVGVSQTVTRTTGRPAPAALS